MVKTNINKASVETKIMAARAGLILDQPFFGSLALRLPMVEKQVVTMCTDGSYIWYDPVFVDAMTVSETKCVLAHEVLHVAMMHMLRRDSRNPSKWNQACDYAINPILKEAGFTFPKKVPPLISNKYNGWTVEKIFNTLPDNENDGDGNPDPGGMGGVTDAKNKQGKPLSESERKQIEQDWKVAVNQAAQQAKQMGSLPAGLKRFVDELVNPKVDWREALRMFVDQTAKNDYTWAKPNRRFIHQNIFLPSLFSEELKPLAIYWDASGSVSLEESIQFGSEINDILEQYKTSVTVIYFDCAVTNVQEFTSEELPVKFKNDGGGGTDFRPPFKEADKLGLIPSCAIVLTDMECDRFPTEPDYPVLWVSTGSNGNNVPFGQVVNIEV